MSVFEDMLRSMIPPELAELLTPEKVKELGNSVNAFVLDVRERLERIETNQNALLEMQRPLFDRLGEAIRKLEETTNERRDSKPARRRKPGSSPDSAGGSPD